MKKYLAIISALFMLAACDKSSDQPEFKTVGLIDEIKISDIETVTSAITEVAFVARFHGFNDHAGGFTDADGKDTRVMLKVPFDAKGTTLVLPKNPPQELLGNIALDFPEGFEISNPAAKTIAFVEIVCNISAQNRFRTFFIWFQILKMYAMNRHTSIATAPQPSPEQAKTGGEIAQSTT